MENIGMLTQYIGLKLVCYTHPRIQAFRKHIILYLQLLGIGDIRVLK
jgi:hypothetical protein